MIDREERRRLQVDPAAPALSSFSQDRPTDSRLWADAVDMSANGRCPVRVGAAQAELHTRSDVGRVPVGGTVFDRRRDRAGKIADRVSLPPPDMALVEVGVGVDEERQHDAPGHRDFRRVAEVERAGGADLGDRALIDENVDDREAVKVERSEWLWERSPEHAGPLESITPGVGERERRGRARDRLLPIVQDLRARHFGRRSRPTPLFTNCRVYAFL